MIAFLPADSDLPDGISDRYVGQMLRLAYLAPAVLDRLLIRRVPPRVRRGTAIR